MLSALVFVVAVTAAPAPLSPDLEQQAHSLEAQVVAPCCWSQQVSVHQSPAADEMRKDIRRRLARGESRQAILDDYVVQFGERILVEPPARGYKLLLYVFPPIAFVLTAAGIIAVVKRATIRRERTAEPATPAASEPYQARLEDELRDLD